MTTELTDHMRSPSNPFRGERSSITDLVERALRRLCAETRSQAAPGVAATVLGQPMAAAMAYALCDEDPDSGQAIVDELLDAGVSVEEVCLDYLAPAARRLGELWEYDKLPFTEVTLATARIQALLRRLPTSRSLACTSYTRGAAFAAVPGEEHTLGVMMAADLFRRNDWDVSLHLGLSHHELISRLGRDDRPVIGLSCSGNHSYAALTRVVSALAKRRPDAVVLLSGQIVQDEDKIAALPGPVRVVRDVADAETEMARMEARFFADAVEGHGAQLAGQSRRASSAR